MTDAELKPQVYRDPRPKEYFDAFHERVRTHAPGPPYEITRLITVAYALTAFRARGLWSERVPNGPLILAPNHASFMDHFFTGAFIRRRVHFMAKSQLFKYRPLEWIFSTGGTFPVRRGAQDEEAFVTAFRILERGGSVVMYCEGGRTRSGRIADRARPGIGRLALESGAPVVPVAILGSQGVRNWKRGRFPKVTVQYGEPFKFEVVQHPSREQQQQAADFVLDRITTLHTELERMGHKAARRAAREVRRRGRRSSRGGPAPSMPA
jgi:1-acyl-sn-glycerol-3-phosphate acyltransferase